MKLLGVYVVIVIAGEIVAFFIGRGIEQMWPTFSLPAFLMLFFAVFGGAWPVAVRLTA